MAVYSGLLNEQNPSEGFTVTYSGGDYCDNEGVERKASFNFHCDKNIEFDVKKVEEISSCHYAF
jgi:hypothetical protein